MKAVFKYKLPTQISKVMMDHDAKILATGVQGDNICIWAEVDTESTEKEFIFEVFGTGHEIPEGMGVEREFIGTVFMHNASYVFHVYHRKN